MLGIEETRGRMGAVGLLRVQPHGNGVLCFVLGYHWASDVHSVRRHQTAAIEIVPGGSVIVVDVLSSTYCKNSSYHCSREDQGRGRVEVAQHPILPENRGPLDGLDADAAVAESGRREVLRVRTIADV